MYQIRQEQEIGLR
uniref:Uncharacterized protein n=1 Tax=Arundo donax TaxID=35708 RepID=A0A0A9ACT0_ARUDO